MSNEVTRNFRPDGTLVIVSGPSGAGKTTLINLVRGQLAQIGIDLHFSVSHTTRQRRAAETDGKDYYFVERTRFEEMVSGGEFLEWAHVHEQMYGTSRREVQARLDRNEDVILDIDVQGAKQIAESETLRPRSLLIFLCPPTLDDLGKRLERRGMNTRREIDGRLDKALGEIVHGLDFYDYIIINDDLRVACSCLEAAIIARKLKSKSALDALEEMAQRFKEERSGRIA